MLFDPASRGRYSTDASIYQIEPVGVAVPRTEADVAAIVSIAAERRIPLLARGAGTSQCGQTVGEALVVDFSKHLNAIVQLDLDGHRATVQPGLVLDRLNQALRPHGLFFPVDVSTGSRATLGGMAGNNSCGARSIRYGNMVHNVHAIEGLLADGTAGRFGPVAGNPGPVPFGADDPGGRLADLLTRVRNVAADHAEAIERRFPKLLRRVGGYNLDTIDPAGHNLASLLVGSEGTLATFTRLELDLQPIPPCRVLGICHFPTFRRAMEATRHIVELGPAAVELVDRTMLDLARAIAMYRPVVERFVRGAPEALLLVEFAGEDPAEPRRRLAALSALMGDLGTPDAVVEATEAADQSAVWEVRKAGLNIMMSMKGDGKPISFIEDCAVRLQDLPDYTDRLNAVFARHGVAGTWYAHASVGCLHVRPVLNLKDEADVRKMRVIAEEAFALVREYRGSHSGEHGDGLVRSEFHEPMFGREVVRAFEAVKDAFDPDGRLNPGKIVRPPRMDDRSLLRYPPGYAARRLDTALDWSEWGGFAGAVEMCNNNGACRKRDPGVMCPSYRVTGDEQHLTRGRANTLRLALSGRLGADAFTSDAVAEALDLCVGCKGCRRECPTGVDMARMKVEFLHHRRRGRGTPLRARLVAWLPRYAPFAARAPALLNAPDRWPLLARLGERWLGFSARRPLPRWRARPLPPAGRVERSGSGRRRAGRRSERRNSAVRRHVHPLVRARDPARGDAGPRGRGASGANRGNRRTAALLRTHLSHQRARRGGPGRGAPDFGRPPPLRRARNAHRRPGALLPVHVPRRTAGAASRAGEPAGRGPDDAAGGMARARGAAGGVAASARAASGARAARAPPRPLPPEGVRRDGDGEGRTRSGSRTGDRGNRIELLWHGRCVRLRGGALRRFDADGGAVPPARGTHRLPGYPRRGGWNELPAADRGRHRTPRPPRRGDTRPRPSGLKIAPRPR